MSDLFIGLMSGTSMDGVDGVLCQLPASIGKGLGPQTLAAAHRPFPDTLRQELMALQSPGNNEIEREALAANGLTRIYAEVVQALLDQAQRMPSQIVAIGAHGQTVRHRPDLGFTRQTANPALLAELTGIDVVADFRSRDVAAGGQGAPLVPAFHSALFGSTEAARVVANIGGIANISIIEPDGTVFGFDTGPGNVLLDLWCQRHCLRPYDAGGAWAAGGSVCIPLLEEMKREPYFSAPPPKSTGRDLFHAGWLDQHLAAWPQLAPVDVQASLCALTAETMADAIARYARDATATFVCGGGAYNAHLMAALAQALRRRLPHHALATTDALGVPPNQVEAFAFAWLAQRHLSRTSANLPSVTGARGPRILGALYPGG